MEYKYIKNKEEILRKLIYHFTNRVLQVRRKPYLPHYGELFVCVRDLKKITRNCSEEIFIYHLHSDGEVYFQPNTHKFIIRLPDFDTNIILSDSDFIDSILDGRFTPLIK